MTIEDLTINWLSRHAGIEDCFSNTGINYNDPDGIPRTGSTADVLNAFFVAHLIGKDTSIIISNTDYSQLKIVNKNQDINLDDVGYVYSIIDYCYIDCLDIECGNVCVGSDLYSQRCEDDTCYVDKLIESNSPTCVTDHCEGVVCEIVCDGYDLWSQKCVDGDCIPDQLIESNSETCGYDYDSSKPWLYLLLMLPPAAWVLMHVVGEAKKRQEQLAL